MVVVWWGGGDSNGSDSSGGSAASGGGVVVTLAKVYWPRERADDRTRVHTPPTKEGCYGAKLSSALPVPAGAPAHDIRRFSHTDRCFLCRQ